MGKLNDQLKGLLMQRQCFEDVLYIGLQADKHYSHGDNICILESLLTMLVLTTALLCCMSEVEPLLEILALNSVSRQCMTTFNCFQ